MAATQQEIRDWFDEGVQKGATHMIVMCDTYDWDDYPIFVKPEQDVRVVEKASCGNMQTVMEVYNLKMDRETQMKQHRAFNY